MRLKYTLNNPTLGEHITAYSPKGWQETELVLKRHEKYEGIFLDYTVKADFFCGAGKEYVDQVKENEGPDGELSVRIDIDCDDSGEYELLYDGQAIMKSCEVIKGAPEYTRVNLEQSGIIQTVLNRLETKIDLTKLETLEGDALTALTYAPYEMTLHGKALVNTGKFKNDIPRATFTQEGSSYVIPLDIEVNELEEILYPGSYDFPIATPIFLNDESFSRDIIFTGRIKVSNLINSGGTLAGSPVVLQYAGGFNINLVLLDPSMSGVSSMTVYSQSVVAASSPVTFDFNITETTYTVPAGYYIAFTYQDTYSSTQVDSLIDFTGDYQYFDETFLQLNDTGIYPDTQCNVFAIFETGADIARKITGQADAFRSNFFGRKNSQPYAYSENGCGSFTAFTNGFQARGFPLADRPVYMSMKEYFDGLNPIHCLGLGVKQEGENTYIEVEPKEYFYRTDEVVLTLNNIRGLVTKYEDRFFYSRFTIGYKDWRKEGLNGLDEFCTTHNYATLVKSFNGELSVQSELIAAPYALEKQRQQRYSETVSTDEDYDDNNFIIALNRSVDIDGIPDSLDIAEKDENFTDVDNVFSPETIYNLRFSPARCARNWYKILSTSLIKLNTTLKNVKFSFAEGNKTMESKGADSCDPGDGELINEGDDLVLSVPNSNSGYNPLFTGDIDTLEDYPLSFSNYSLLKEVDEEGIPNYYKMVRYSLTDQDYYFGFIDELRYKPVTGKSSWRFRRAYITDTDCTHIYVEAGYVECGYVE